MRISDGGPHPVRDVDHDVGAKRASHPRTQADVVRGIEAIGAILKARVPADTTDVNESRRSAVRSLKRLLVPLARLVVALAAATAAFARGGWGWKLFGGGNGGGDGGDAAGLRLVRVLIWLVFRHRSLASHWSSSCSSSSLGWRIGAVPQRDRRVSGGLHGAAPARRAAANLTPVRTGDPFFSEPLFLDFAQLVYARAHELRGMNAREPLVPWMAPAAIDKLFADRSNLDAVSSVIFGATRILSASTDAGFVRVDVEFEANLTEIAPASPRRDGERALGLRRSRRALPRQARMRALGCADAGRRLNKTDARARLRRPPAWRLSQWEVPALTYQRALSCTELALRGRRGRARYRTAALFDPGSDQQARVRGKHSEHLVRIRESVRRVSCLQPPGRNALGAGAHV